MTATDTPTHVITWTTQRPRYPGMAHTYTATCTCHWTKRGLDHFDRDREIGKHKFMTGAVIGG